MLAFFLLGAFHSFLGCVFFFQTNPCNQCSGIEVIHDSSFDCEIFFLKYRYMGKEAYAPGTYLKKATNGQTHALMEKSRLSGVQIISSLQDVSTLLNQDKKVNIDFVNWTKLNFHFAS